MVLNEQSLNHIDELIKNFTYQYETDKKLILTNWKIVFDEC